MTIHHQSALVPVATVELSAALAPDLAKAADLARQEKAQATQRAYRSDFEIFRAWCAAFVKLTHYRPSLSQWRLSGVRGRKGHPALDYRPPGGCDPLCP